jgi:hypothetical protein
MESRTQLFELTWRAKWLADGVESIEGMAQALEAEAAHLRRLAAEGVELKDEVGGDYAFLRTTDPGIAAKYNFEAVEEQDEEGGALVVVGVGQVGKLGSATDV